MFRARIYAQAFTLVAMVGGSYYYREQREKEKSRDVKIAEMKAREKQQAWIRELEVRDKEDKEVSELRIRVGRWLMCEGSGVVDREGEEVVGEEVRGGEAGKGGGGGEEQAVT